MPFTLAHPAVVLPLRRYANFGGLVIGSLVPDFGYFLALPIPRYYTHSVLGLFMSCLPLGLLAYLAYYTLLRRPLLDLAPAALAGRLPESVALPATAGQWLSVANAILMGALLHVLWDEFTHATWRQGQLFPWMRNEVLRIGSQPLRLLDFSNYGSTALGLGLIAWYTTRWWRRNSPRQAASEARRMTTVKRSLVLSSAGVFVAVWIAVAGYDGQGGGRLSGESFAAQGAAAGLRALTVVVFVYALSWQFLHRLSCRLRPSSSTDR